MNKMTIKEACLKALENMGGLATHNEVLEIILEKKYYDFGGAHTPAQTVSALLGDFIRKGDSRVKRIRNANATYSYYLTKYSDKVEHTSQEGTENVPLKQVVFHERDLHPLLSTYLRSNDIFSKTIYHEKSKRGDDKDQKWIHPDMVGVEFLPLKTKETQRLLRAINGSEIFRIYSYEIKKEIRNDSDLKMSYFQAVSNSSWAHYGYLAAFEINSSLMDEMERLTKSFGVGIIEIGANPYEGKVLFPAHYSELDMQTIDKLANVNRDFKSYIALIEEVLSESNEKKQHRIVKEIQDVNEEILINDSDVKNYCLKHQIPYENNDE